ncbi:MAG: hypothetical protein IPP55_14580 [Anaerolineales bacterium]|nr:hypothetical protein [Anaerolineales bacterium]MBP7346587.1 hypothetical protein [Sediminibacterium sp.]
MGVREQRLSAEYSSIKKWRSEVVTWKVIGNSNPPDKYEFTYNLKSIIGFDPNKNPMFHQGFKVIIEFPSTYPRTKPEVFMATERKPWPFHPNIWKDGRICLEGDDETRWIPGIGRSLDSICQMVGEIIAFQEVNTDSPANNDPTLEEWIKKNIKFEEGAANRAKNPVDKSIIRLPDIEDTLVWGKDEKSTSSNSGKIIFGE